MRAQKDPAYSTLLENIGNGLVNGVEDNNVQLEQKCIVQKPDDVINFIYGNMESEVSIYRFYFKVFSFSPKKLLQVVFLPL